MAKETKSFDVRGYGLDPETAVRDLCDMLVAQVSFAVQQGHPESVWHHADEKYWAMFEEERRNLFIAEVSGAELPPEPFADIVSLPLVALKHRDEWIAARA